MHQWLESNLRLAESASSDLPRSDSVVAPPDLIRLLCVPAYPDDPQGLGLKKSKPDLYQQVIDGNMSANQAAIEGPVLGYPVAGMTHTLPHDRERNFAFSQQINGLSTDRGYLERSGQLVKGNSLAP